MAELHNNPVEFPCPSYATALIAELRRGIARTYWNVKQKEWPGSSAFDWWTLSKEGREQYPKEDPEQIDIPGMTWFDYYNWGGSPEDPDWDQTKANRPNFCFESVEIRWYKHFGRSMNCNMAWTPEQWVRWYDRAEQTLRAYEARRSPAGDALYLGEKPNYPDPAARVPLEPSEAGLYHLKLLERIDLLEAQLNVVACEAIWGLEARAGKPRPSYDPEPLKPDDYRYTSTLRFVQQLTGVIPRDENG